MKKENKTIRVSAREVMNAGKHPLRKSGAFLRGMLLPGTPFGNELGWDAGCPQLTVHCDAPGFSPLVNALHDEESKTMVGVVRTTIPGAPNLFCIVYENEQQGLWLCINPGTKTARRLLRSIQEHQRFHIAFLSNGRTFNNRQDLVNTLVSKELMSLPDIAEECARSNDAKENLERNVPHLQVMHALAEMEEKPRLFVMMHEVSLANYETVRNMLPMN